jgi:DNA-binding HxlR family transcriptional regulator
MKEIKQRSDCPISYSLDILGDKWTLLILRDMIFNGKTAYGEFLQSQEKIATNILADRLSVLYYQGLINKKVAADKKSKFVYSLTEKGIGLIPTIMELTIWGARYSPFGGLEALLEELRKDKEGTIQRYCAILKKRAADFVNQE